MMVVVVIANMLLRLCLCLSVFILLRIGLTTFDIVVRMDGTTRGDDAPRIEFSQSGYSSVSDRYDEDTRTVTANMFDGKTAVKSEELDHDYYYQKYGGQSNKGKGDFDLVVAFMNSIGISTTTTALAEFVKAFKGWR